MLSSNMRSKSILIIDDDAGIRNSFEAILQGDYQITKAASGKEGLAVLNKQEVSLVLLDIRMPAMDGLEVLRVLRRLYPWIMVLIISVSHGSGYRRSGPGARGE